MDSSQPLADSGPTLPKSRRNLAAILIFGCLILVAGLFGRHLLLQHVNNLKFDPTPSPRPRINAPFITSADSVVDKMVEIAQLTKSLSGNNTTEITASNGGCEKSPFQRFLVKSSISLEWRKI